MRHLIFNRPVRRTTLVGVVLALAVVSGVVGLILFRSNQSQARGRCDTNIPGLKAGVDNLQALVNESRLIVTGSLASQKGDEVLIIDEHIKPRNSGLRKIVLCPTEVTTPSAQYLVFLTAEHVDGWEVSRDYYGIMPQSVPGSFVTGGAINNRSPTATISAADVRMAAQ